MLARQGRPVGRLLRHRLNTGFLVVGHRDRPRLANLAAQQSFIENLYRMGRKASAFKPRI